MKAILSVFIIGLFSTNLSARPISLTIATASEELTFETIQFREQTTRQWLLGCRWPDVLQHTGWFPATFYNDIEPVELESGDIFYEFGKRSKFAAYCGAQTDNVANYVSITTIDESTGRTLYGGIPLDIGNSDATEVTINCSVADKPDYGLHIDCERAFLADHAELFINLEFN